MSGTSTPLGTPLANADWKFATNAANPEFCPSNIFDRTGPRADRGSGRRNSLKLEARDLNHSSRDRAIFVIRSTGGFEDLASAGGLFTAAIDAGLPRTSCFAFAQIQREGNYFGRKIGRKITKPLHNKNPSKGGTPLPQSSSPPLACHWAQLPD